MISRTQANGSKTAKSVTRHSALNIANKDPNFDYSFRRKEDIEQGGGVDVYGYRPVGADSKDAESYGGPAALFHKSRGKNQIVNLDTVLCKRPKEVAEYFKSLEDDKYNSQVMFVRDATKNSRDKLRSIDPRAVLTDNSDFSGKPFTQRTGKTEDVGHDVYSVGNSDKE